MYKIQEIFNHSYEDYCNSFNPSTVQHKATLSIQNCKTGKHGHSTSTCKDCGHTEVHNNSCRNRSCPCCQAVQKELWIDARKAEVIDSPYVHVVFTLPAELNPIIYSNQSLLYSAMHKCASETLITLSADDKYLGATPGIIQVLHTWGQEMNYHPHIHCIVTGACKKLVNSYHWKAFKDYLYNKTWIPYIKETFNGFGNARIKTVTNTDTTFTAKDYKTGKSKEITVSNKEFIRQFLMHVLPSGFQKIHYYGFLNNRSKKKNLELISKLTGKELFKSLYINMKLEERLLSLWNIDVRMCKKCGCSGMRPSGRVYPLRN